MYLTIIEILQTECESVQQCWMIAQTMGEKVAAIVNMGVRAVTPDALREMGLSAKALMGKVEARLCAANISG